MARCPALAEWCLPDDKGVRTRMWEMLDGRPGVQMTQANLAGLVAADFLFRLSYWLALIPIYLIFNRNGLIFKDWGSIDLGDWNLIDTFTGMIPLMMLLNLPIIIWMLYTYFKEIPYEILEAARMDGAGLFKELWNVLAPMAVPGIASTVLLNVILAWNEAFWTLNLTNKYAAPLSFFISEYSSPEGQFWAKLSAASLMAIAPIMVLGWFSQKQLVRGLTFGAVK